MLAGGGEAHEDRAQDRPNGPRIDVKRVGVLGQVWPRVALTAAIA